MIERVKRDKKGATDKCGASDFSIFKNLRSGL